MFENYYYFTNNIPLDATIKLSYVELPPALKKKRSGFDSFLIIGHSCAVLYSCCYI